MEFVIKRSETSRIIIKKLGITIQIIMYTEGKDSIEIAKFHSGKCQGDMVYQRHDRKYLIVRSQSVIFRIT